MYKYRAQLGNATLAVTSVKMMNFALNLDELFVKQ